MSHLTLETLARLVDEAPDPVERRHLVECGRCRSELAALGEQTSLLASLPDLAPPPDGWPELRDRLRQEGLVAGRPARAMPALRAAAATFLFLAGGALGYAVRGPAAEPAAGSAPRIAEVPRSGTTPSTVADRPDPTLATDMAGEEFMAALDRYMASSGAPASDPAARLAALDNIVLTTAEALNEAPTDPIISSYHLSALAQREAVLRQLGLRRAEPVF